MTPQSPYWLRKSSAFSSMGAKMYSIAFADWAAPEICSGSIITQRLTVSAYCSRSATNFCPCSTAWPVYSR